MKSFYLKIAGIMAKVFVRGIPMAMVVDCSSRDRYGNFHQQIPAILRNQEQDFERLAGSLYAKGLTQEQVCEVFREFYGDHYSKASVSRMLDYVRKEAEPPRCGRSHSN